MTPPGDRPLRTPARAFFLFTTLRVLLFLVVYVVVQLVVEDTLLAVGLAVVLSAVLGIPLLRPYRDDLNRAVAARRHPENG